MTEYQVTYRITTKTLDHAQRLAQATIKPFVAADLVEVEEVGGSTLTPKQVRQLQVTFGVMYASLKDALAYLVEQGGNHMLRVMLSEAVKLAETPPEKVS